MKFAPTVGISVDHRRRREAGLDLENVELLKSYLAKLVVLPRANTRLLTRAEKRLPAVLTAEQILVIQKSTMIAKVPSEDEKQFSPRIARLRAKGEAFKLKRKIKAARGQIE